MKFLIRIQFIILLMLSHTAMANPDSGLYDPLPPEGAAFVRFVNMSGITKGSKEAKVGGKSYMHIKHGEVSPYFVRKEGDVTIIIGDATQKLSIAPEKSYTVILEKKGHAISIQEDEVNTNQAKAQLNIYNTSTYNPISLKAKAGKIDVIKDVATDDAGFRPINPVKIDLSIMNAKDALFELGDKTLERGQTYSLFFVDNNEAFWVENTLSTTK